MALPIRPITYPAVLAGQPNGRLPASILVDTPGQKGGATVTLVLPAARGWRAMEAEALAAGHVLKTGFEDSSYRIYQGQKRIFLQRYYQHPLGDVYWAGKRWRKRAGVAAAAPPGSSNHGLGLAIDVGEERDGDTGAESLDQGTLNWLIANAHRFGFSWELQSEPWHLRWVVGDAIPAAVLAFEKHAGTPGSPVVWGPTEEDDDMPISIAYDEKVKKFRVFVQGEGSTLVDEPDHWVDVIKKSKATGFPISSPWLEVLIYKIRIERE